MEKLNKLLKAIENATSLEEIKQIKIDFGYAEIAQQMNNISKAIYEKVEYLYLKCKKNKQKYIKPLNKYGYKKHD